MKQISRPVRSRHVWFPGLCALVVARRCLGVFYLAMAWGVNVFVTLPMAQDVVAAFARDAWIPLYRSVLEAVAVPHAVAVIVATICFETVVAVAMLFGSARIASWGMLLGAAWCTALLPVLVWPYIAPMLPLIALQLWLFSRLRRISPDRPGAPESAKRAR